MEQSEKTEQKITRMQWMVLLTVIVGTFLGRLDQTIVNLALPKIIDEYGISVSAAGWIATAYIIANAVFVPIWGKLGDTIGRKKVYLMGFGIFILGSVLAGIAWDLPSMIVFRVIQAIAGSADYPTAMAILAVTFPPGKPRAQALGIWSASFAAAAVLGPFVGGPLIDWFNWRSVFLINLPVGLIGIWMAMKYVEESVSEVKTVKFDWWGAGALGLCLAILVLVLDKGMDWGWTSLYSLVSYVLILLSGIWFYFIEVRHPEPIVDFKFFRMPVFVNTLTNNFIVFMGMMGSIFLIPVFAQTYLGYDATHAGYLFIPMAVFMMIGAPLGGRLTGKVEPRYVIVASTLVAAFGIYLFSFLDPKSTAIDIMIPLSIMAFGMGFGMAQRTNVIASVVPAHEIGIASSVLALARNLSGAFGIAIFSTVLSNTIKSNILNLSKFSTINAVSPTDMQKGIGLIILKAQVSAYGYVYFISAMILVFGAVLAYFMKTDKNAANQAVHVE